MVPNIKGAISPQAALLLGSLLWELVLFYLLIRNRVCKSRPPVAWNDFLCLVGFSVRLASREHSPKSRMLLGWWNPVFCRDLKLLPGAVGCIVQALVAGNEIPPHWHRKWENISPDKWHLTFPNRNCFRYSAPQRENKMLQFQFPISLFGTNPILKCLDSSQGANAWVVGSRIKKLLAFMLSIHQVENRAQPMSGSDAAAEGKRGSSYNKHRLNPESSSTREVQVSRTFTLVFQQQEEVVSMAACSLVSSAHWAVFCTLGPFSQVWWGCFGNQDPTAAQKSCMAQTSFENSFLWEVWAALRAGMWEEKWLLHAGSPSNGK